MVSTKTADAKTPAISAKLVRTLAGHMRDSLLPGDEELDNDRLEEAARFLGEAAMQRNAQRSAIAFESASEERRFMRIAIVNDDMPFLVDSTAAAISGSGLAIDRLIHPVVGVKRDDDGELVLIHHPSSRRRRNPSDAMMELDDPDMMSGRRRTRRTR